VITVGLFFKEVVLYGGVFEGVVLRLVERDDQA
jgi:hypothetical protein